jgi:HlyD family secretion protein
LKVAIAILVTAITVSGLAVGVGRSVGLTRAGRELVAPVRIEPVTRGSLIEFITAPGKIEPKTKVAISARVAARIVALPCEEGEEVVRGETVLVQLDSKDLEAALQSTAARRNAQAASIEVDKADLAAMRAELRLRELELNRHRQLLASRDVSQQAVDEMQTAYEAMAARIDSKEKNLIVLQHNVESADAEIERAQDQLSYTTIVSPIDGVVAKLNSEVGELAIVGTTNTPGTTILEVADLSRMILKAEVDEADVGGVREGQKAKVRVQAYPNRIFDGVVTQVALTATEQQSQSKFFEVQVLLDTGGDRIYSGLTADVDIEVAEHGEVLKVPSQAVVGRPIDDLPSEIRDSNLIDRGKTVAAVVYRAVNGKAVATPVRISASDGAYTIIQTGLSEGEQVIVGPYKVLESLAHSQSIADEKTMTDEQRKAYYDRHTTITSNRRRGPF